MTNTNAIKNFAYFCCNYPHDFIEKAWGKNHCLIDHLKSKFNQYANENSSGFGLMIKFLLNLDSENQDILIDWINKNYTAFSDFKELEITHPKILKTLYSHLGVFYEDIFFFDKEYSDITRTKELEYLCNHTIEINSGNIEVEVYKLIHSEKMLGLYTKNLKFEMNN